MIELVVALLLDIGADAVDAVAAGTAPLLLLLLLLQLAELLLAPATTAVAADCPLDDFDAPLSLAQLNLSPQLPFLDLAPVEDDVAAPVLPDC